MTHQKTVSKQERVLLLQNLMRVCNNIFLLQLKWQTFISAGVIRTINVRLKVKTDFNFIYNTSVHHAVDML